MKKIYETKIGNRAIVPGCDQNKFGKQKYLSWGRILSYLNVLVSTTMKFIYLLFGLAGLAAAVIITIRVIYLTSISNINMILIFGAACLSLAAMRAGFYGFYELIRGGK